MADDAGFSLIMHYDPLMVAELAMGAEHPHEIADRYGVDEDDYEHLASQDWFQRLVAAKRTEFHEQGVLFTAKAAMMAETLLTRLFQQGMANVLTPPLVVEVAKQLTDIGRLKPQPLSTQPSTAGSGFQINIQVNGADVVARSTHLQPVPVDVMTAAADASAPSGEGASAGTPSFRLPLPAPIPQPRPVSKATPEPNSPGDTQTGVAKLSPPPAYISNLRVPDFDLRPSALVGVAAAQQAAVAVPPPATTPLGGHEAAHASPAVLPRGVGLGYRPGS
jgi:hypothetical protein